MSKSKKLNRTKGIKAILKASFQQYENDVETIIPLDKLGTQKIS